MRRRGRGRHRRGSVHRCCREHPRSTRASPNRRCSGPPPSPGAPARRIGANTHLRHPGNGGGILRRGVGRRNQVPRLRSDREAFLGKDRSGPARHAGIRLAGHEVRRTARCRRGHLPPRSLPPLPIRPARSLPPRTPDSDGACTTPSPSPSNRPGRTHGRLGQAKDQLKTRH